MLLHTSRVRIPPGARPLTLRAVSRYESSLLLIIAREPPFDHLNQLIGEQPVEQRFVVHTTGRYFLVFPVVIAQICHTLTVVFALWTSED